MEINQNSIITFSNSDGEDFKALVADSDTVAIKNVATGDIEFTDIDEGFLDLIEEGEYMLVGRQVSAFTKGTPKYIVELREKGELPRFNILVYKVLVHPEFEGVMLTASSKDDSGDVVDFSELKSLYYVLDTRKDVEDLIKSQLPSTLVKVSSLVHDDLVLYGLIGEDGNTLHTISNDEVQGINNKDNWKIDYLTTIVYDINGASLSNTEIYMLFDREQCNNDFELEYLNGTVRMIDNEPWCVNKKGTMMTKIEPNQDCLISNALKGLY